MSKKYTLIEKEVISAVKTKQYIVSESSEERPVALTLWKSLVITLYHRFIKKYFT